MHEEYLQDAHEFFSIGQKSKDEREARRYFRASVFYAAGAIEAFVNYIADSFAKADSLTAHEIAFLSDKNLYFSSDKFVLVEKTEFHRLEDKLKFLLKKFEPTFNFQSSAWSRLSEFKKLRDTLTHPKQSEDELTIEEYRKRLELGITGTIEIMNALSKCIFKSPLRRGILDLIP